MSSTATVRGSGGAVFEMDVPSAGRALDQWNEKLAKGDLVIIEKPVEKPTPAPKVTKSAKKETATDAEE